MTAYASANFPCPRCGALFALSEKIASRKIQCPCGQIFTAPPMPEFLPDPEPYDIDINQSESPSTPPPAPAQISSSHADLYPHRGLRSFATDDSDAEFSLARDRVIPIILLLTGLALRIAELPYDRTLIHANLLAALAITLFQIVLAVTLMLAGVLAASKILATNFGDVATAILKLAAMAIFAWAVGGAIIVFLQYDIRAFVIAIHVIFIIYAITFWTLFSLDVQEALLTVAICALLQNAAVLVVYAGGK